MPILATFIGSIASWMVGFFSRYLGYRAAISLASFLTWLTVLGTFIFSVSACLNSLYAFVGTTGGGGGGGGNLMSFFWTGLGMFVPANAGAVLSCMGSVWIGCQVYKIRKSGIQNYSR